MAKMTSVDQGNNKKKGGFGGGWIFLIVIFLLAVTFVPKLTKLSLPAFGTTNGGGIPQAEVKDYVRFATRVAVSINNVGFHNLSTYVDDNSSYFSEDTLNDFQTHFFTPELQHMIQNFQLFAFAQNLHSIDVSEKNGRVIVWFVGDTLFTSKISNTSIKLPMSFKLMILKTNNEYKVVNFENVVSQS